MESSLKCLVVLSFFVFTENFGFILSAVITNSSNTSINSATEFLPILIRSFDLSTDNRSNETVATSTATGRKIESKFELNSTIEPLKTLFKLKRVNVSNIDVERRAMDQTTSSTVDYGLGITLKTNFKNRTEMWQYIAELMSNLVFKNGSYPRRFLPDNGGKTTKDQVVHSRYFPPEEAVPIEPVNEATTKNRAVVPLPTEHDDQKIVTSSARPVNQEVVPSSARPVNQEVVPSSARPVNQEVVPSSARPVNQEVVPSSARPVNQEVVPSSARPVNQEVVPSSARPVNQEVVPSSARPVNQEVVPSSARPVNQEVVPSSARPVNQEMVPSSARPVNQEMVPSSARPENQKGVPSFAKPENQKGVPSFAEPENQNGVPSFAEPEDQKGVPTFAEPENQEVVPSSTRPVNQAMVPSIAEPENQKLVTSIAELGHQSMVHLQAKPGNQSMVHLQAKPGNQSMVHFQAKPGNQSMVHSQSKPGNQSMVHFQAKPGNQSMVHSQSKPENFNVTPSPAEPEDLESEESKDPNPVIFDFIEDLTEPTEEPLLDIRESFNHLEERVLPLREMVSYNATNSTGEHVWSRDISDDSSGFMKDDPTEERSFARIVEILDEFKLINNRTYSPTNGQSEYLEDRMFSGLNYTNKTQKETVEHIVEIVGEFLKQLNDTLNTTENRDSTSDHGRLNSTSSKDTSAKLLEVLELLHYDLNNCEPLLNARRPIETDIDSSKQENSTEIKLNNQLILLASNVSRDLKTVQTRLDSISNSYNATLGNVTGRLDDLQEFFKMESISSMLNYTILKLENLSFRNHKDYKIETTNVNRSMDNYTSNSETWPNDGLYNDSRVHFFEALYDIHSVASWFVKSVQNQNDSEFKTPNGPMNPSEWLNETMAGRSAAFVNSSSNAKVRSMHFVATHFDDEEGVHELLQKVADKIAIETEKIHQEIEEFLAENSKEIQANTNTTSYNYTNSFSDKNSSNAKTSYDELIELELHLERDVEEALNETIYEGRSAGLSESGMNNLLIQFQEWMSGAFVDLCLSNYTDEQCLMLVHAVNTSLEFLNNTVASLLNGHTPKMVTARFFNEQDFINSPNDGQNSDGSGMEKALKNGTNYFGQMAESYKGRNHSNDAYKQKWSLEKHLSEVSFEKVKNGRMKEMDKNTSSPNATEKARLLTHTQLHESSVNGSLSRQDMPPEENVIFGMPDSTEVATELPTTKPEESLEERRDIFIIRSSSTRTPTKHFVHATTTTYTTMDEASYAVTTVPTTTHYTEPTTHSKVTTTQYVEEPTTYATDTTETTPHTKTMIMSPTYVDTTTVTTPYEDDTTTESNTPYAYTTTPTVTYPNTTDYKTTTQHLVTYTTGPNTYYPNDANSYGGNGGLKYDKEFIPSYHGYATKNPTIDGYYYQKGHDYYESILHKYHRRMCYRSRDCSAKLKEVCITTHFTNYCDCPFHTRRNKITKVCETRHLYQFGYLSRKRRNAVDVESEIVKNGCSDDLCLRRGTCHVWNDVRVCTCDPWYFGKRCQFDIIFLGALLMVGMCVFVVTYSLFKVFFTAVEDIFMRWKKSGQKRSRRQRRRS